MENIPVSPRINTIRTEKNMPPHNLSELIALLLNIQVKRNSGDNTKIVLSDRDLEIILKILLTTRKNVLNHGRTAIDAKEELEGSSGGVSGWLGQWWNGNG